MTLSGLSKRISRILIALTLAGSALGCDPERERWEAAIEGDRRPERIDAEGLREQQAIARDSGDPTEKRILFGDLHVHTSYSFDGYLFALPLMGGEGAHPPNDACDYARYCAGLDFYALTDHAESLLPRTWEASRESIRQCNRMAGDADDPDLVAFLGFEWSQAGETPETHFGHRCVFFRDTEDDELPTRPIGSRSDTNSLAMIRDNIGLVRWVTPWHWQEYGDYMDFTTELVEQPNCPPGVPVRELPEGCKEVADTPAVLREKLDDWGFEALVVPHGMTWGTYTPATATIAKHLDPAQFDPQRQLLLEVMSGHGNSEEYRDFQAWSVDAAGNRVCPEPTEGYLPCCWQAGEIMRSRCEGLEPDECERRVREARALAAQAYTRPQQVFPDASREEWLDCGQCRDCFKPSFDYRPRESAQYAMALTHPEAVDEDGKKLRFRYGFVGSSDGHTARPGTGYKNVERSMMTDAVGNPNPVIMKAQELASGMDDPQKPEAPVAGEISMTGNDLRVANFLYPGGIAAVHSEGRDREAIWAAMKRREVYGTSGPRMLLWFDMIDPDGTRHPMGSELERTSSPRFEVRAIGAPVQKPGCPDWIREGLSPQRLERLCRNECNNPGDERLPISAIEVIRIRPQASAGEPIAPLIEDPWLRFECPRGTEGCTTSFEDPEFPKGERDTLYYVRALQSATPAINGAQLRTQFDDRGRATSIDWCAPDEGECLSPVEERAWSSPIFVDWAPASPGPGDSRPTPRRSDEPLRGLSTP